MSKWGAPPGGPPPDRPRQVRRKFQSDPPYSLEQEYARRSLWEDEEEQTAGGPVFWVPAPVSPKHVHPPFKHRHSFTHAKSHGMLGRVLPEAPIVSFSVDHSPEDRPLPLQPLIPPSQHNITAPLMLRRQKLQELQRRASDNNKLLGAPGIGLRLGSGRVARDSLNTHHQAHQAAKLHSHKYIGDHKTPAQQAPPLAPKCGPLVPVSSIEPRLVQVAASYPAVLQALPHQPLPYQPPLSQQTPSHHSQNTSSHSAVASNTQLSQHNSQHRQSDQQSSTSETSNANYSDSAAATDKVTRKSRRSTNKLDSIVENINFPESTNADLRRDSKKSESHPDTEAGSRRNSAPKLKKPSGLWNTRRDSIIFTTMVSSDDEKAKTQTPPSVPHFGLESVVELGNETRSARGQLLQRLDRGLRKPSVTSGTSYLPPAPLPARPTAKPIPTPLLPQHPFKTSDDVASGQGGGGTRSRKFSRALAALPPPSNSTSTPSHHSDQPHFPPDDDDEVDLQPSPLATQSVVVGSLELKYTHVERKRRLLEAKLLKHVNKGNELKMMDIAKPLF